MADLKGFCRVLKRIWRRVYNSVLCFMAGRLYFFAAGTEWGALETETFSMGGKRLFGGDLRRFYLRIGGHFFRSERGETPLGVAL
ncbi:MAG: hypothetical protein DBX55_06830 [Verrucomicrobia bacterium]|nr:MAG: hypothetical protein DBX55_06830 [Verrucomicrobiota bacterium]